MRHARESWGMRITVEGGLLGSAASVDVDVVPGATVAEILDTLGARIPTAWCGRQRLTRDHAAGIYPLLHGAVLSESARTASAPPRGSHIAVVAGPDTGLVAECGGTLTIGRAADVAIADHAMSRVHAEARVSNGSLSLHDSGSTNGVATARDPRVSAPVALMGESWIALRDGAGAISEIPSTAPHSADAPSASEGATAPRRVAAMTGAGASAIVLAAVTGRWYLALLALVYPAFTLGPELLRRLRPERVAPLARLPDPTRPGSADALARVAVTGERALREATARAEILARGRRPPPHAQGLSESWLEWLPPTLPGDGDIVVVDAAPSWCDRELVATSSATAVKERGVLTASGPPVRVSQSTAEWAARRIASEAHHAALPLHVRWADLPPPDAPDQPARLMRASLGLAVTAHGTTPWVLDLDAHGPHLLIAGTTGSGKSALLQTLVLALAAAHPPHHLELALMDFKGGAALADCAALPHVVGVVTDLDGRQARRALAAVGAALAERKVSLAKTTHSSFAQWEASGDAPPRLVIVVDEFQEIGALHREFVPELTRLAAQGRSLGMHLVLATQRPSGAVTPEIRANMSTTVALRVASHAESRDLVGTPDAATLPSDAPGRAIVAQGGTRLTVQSAMPSATPSPRVRRANAHQSPAPADLTAWVADRHRQATRAKALWHPPLADHWAHHEVSSAPGLIALGIADRPERRERSALEWDPRSGPLAVVGPPGSARTAVLDVVAAGAARAGFTAVRLPSDAREAARTVWLADATPDSLLIVDDVAAALGALATVDRGMAADALLARAASSRAVALGLGAGSHHRVAAHASMRVVMTGIAPHDDGLWGVPRELADVPHHARAVRAWSSDGWCEARIAVSEAPAVERLVQPLPSDPPVDPAAGVVGIGGDEAQAIALAAGRHCAVVGPPGGERDEVVALLVAAGAGAVDVADAPMFLKAGAREGLVVVTEPTSRLAQELCRDGALGLVDEHPSRGRVLWVDGGVGWCVQLGLGLSPKRPR